MGGGIQRRKSNPNVHELLLSVVYCSVCAPTFSIKPQLLATEEKKKKRKSVRTYKVAEVPALSLSLEKNSKNLSSVEGKN